MNPTVSRLKYTTSHRPPAVGGVVFLGEVILCLRRVVARTKVLTMVVIIIMAFFTYQRNLLLMTRCNQRQPILLIILSKSQGVTAFVPGFEFQFRESRPPSDFRCL